MAKPEERLEKLIFAFADLLNALESAVIAARQHLKELGPAKKQWRPEKIRWVQAESASGKGPFERADPKQGGQDFRSMLQDIKNHGGFMQRSGYRYWVFPDKATVGRRLLLRKVAEAKPEAGSDPAQFFPENLRSLLSFEQRADMVIIKPRQFLGPENFAKILAIVTEHNGEYVSAGKNSHFRIPIKVKK